MNIRFWLAAAAACCAFSLDAALVPGEPAPDLVVRDVAGTTVRLSAYRQKKHIALLVAPPDRLPTADWAGTERRLAALDTVVLFNDGPAATLLIDQTGVVRRVLTGSVLTGTGLTDFVELWQSGKAWFAGYCARCHGADGEDTWCDQKPLTGVGQRLSPTQIRETLNMWEVNDQEVIIRGERIKRPQVDAIIVYVSSL
ncbi:exported hypothetical protein [Candidatus Sulfopaludibacter sp. SbA3]|nr:exported hypothetical protein [Candidatus Sulfopaludibacter sp. SbA3]